MNTTEEHVSRLSFRDIEAADSALAAINALAVDGGPLSKEAFDLMRSGGYEVTFELSIRKTGARMAIDLIKSGDYELASSIVSSLNEDPSLASVGWEIEQPQQDTEPEPEPEPEPEAEPEAEPEPEPDTDRSASRIDAIRKAAEKVYGPGTGVSQAGMAALETRSLGKTPYPVRAMGLSDAKAFMDQYVARHRMKDVQLKEGVCSGSRVLLGDRPVTVLRILADGTAMVNRVGTRYHSIVNVQALSGLFPVRSGEQFEAKAGDRVSVSLGDSSGGPRTYSREGTVASVLKSGSVDVKLDDTGSVCTYPSWSLSAAGS